MCDDDDDVSRGLFEFVKTIRQTLQRELEGASARGLTKN